MAEEMVVKEVLTEEMKCLGATLTRALDEAGWPIVAAFWYFESDYNRWKLMLASPHVSAHGSGETYMAVIHALESLNLSRTNINYVRAVAPEHPVVSALASAFQTGWTITGIPFSRQAIDRSIIDDAYIYRVTSESAAA
jgi:hypothetical protein